MPKGTASFRWLRLSTTALLVFGGLGAVYFFSYVSARRADYIDRSFRALATTAEDFSARLRQIGNSLKQVSDKDTMLGAGDAERNSTITKTIRLTPGLRPSDSAGFDPRGLLQDVTGAAIQVEPSQQRLRFRYEEDGRETQYALTDLADQVQATHLNNLFDQVFVIAQHGAILYREGEELGLTRLNTLVTSDGAPLPLDSMQGASRSLEVRLAGEKRRLFLHPFSLPYPAVTVGIDTTEIHLLEDLLFVGVVRSGQIAAASRQLPTDIVLVLLTIVLLGMLSAPILKVWFLGEAERFGLSDVFLLVGAGVVGTALLTFAVLDIAAYRSIRSRLDQESEALASRILSNLATELAQAHQQLTEFFGDSALVLDPSGELPDVVEIAADTSSDYYPRRYPYLEMFFWADAGGTQRQKWTVRPASTPRLLDISDRRYYRNALLPQLATPILGFVGEHDSLTRGRLFAFDLIQSRTTGQSILVVSMPLDSSKAARSMGALVTQPLSLAAAALPLGVRFAFVEDDGQVALSSELRQRRENLLQECGDNQLVAAALAARRAEHLTARCYGTEWRLYLKPVGDQPFTLALMRDLTVLGGLNFEVLMAGLLLYCIPVVVLLLGLGIAMEMRLGLRPTWVWPDSARVPAYFQAAAVALAAGVFLIIADAWAPAGASAGLTVAVPALTLLLVALIVWRPPGSMAPIHKAYGTSMLGVVAGIVVAVTGGGVIIGTASAVVLALLASPGVGRSVFGPTLRWREKGLQFGFAGLCVALLLSLSVAPSYVLFRDALDHAMESWTRAAQLHAAQAALDHDARIRTRIPLDSLPPLQLEVKGDTATVQPESLGVYASSFFSEQTLRCSIEHERRHGQGFRRPLCIAPPGDSRSEWPDSTSTVAWPGSSNVGLGGLARRHFTGLLPALAPVYSSAVLRTRRITIDRLEDNRWQWSLPTHDRHILFGDDIPNTDSVIQIASVVPEWSPADLNEFTLPLAAAGALAVVLAFGLSLSLARLVFGLPLESEVTLDHRERIDLNIRENRLLLLPPKDTVEWLRDHAETHYVDLTRELADKDRVPDAPLVVLDHFDYRLDDPVHAQFRFKLLKDLVFVQRKRVVLISGIDPLHYLRDVLPEVRPETRGGNAPSADEWAEVLAKFKHGRFLPAAQSALRHSRASQRRTLSVTRRSSGAQRAANREEALALLLDVECAEDSNLKRYAEDVRHHSRFTTLTAQQVVGLLGELAEAYYRTLWNTCTVRERLLLYSLAQRGFVNPKTWNSVRSLRRRGLIIKDPSFRLKNESFRQFVLRAESPSTIADWEQAKAESPWSKLRTPLVAAALAIAVFFFVTQRDQVAASMAFITSFAALLPAVVRLMSMSVSAGRGGRGDG